MARGEGIKWQDVDPASLGSDYAKRFDSYRSNHDKNEADAKKLREDIQAKWDKDNPGGVNGKRLSVKIVNGTIQAGETALLQLASSGLKLFPR
jgi:hypothetical protein